MSKESDAVPSAGVHGEAVRDRSHTPRRSQRDGEASGEETEYATLGQQPRRRGSRMLLPTSQAFPQLPVSAPLAGLQIGQATLAAAGDVHMGGNQNLVNEAFDQAITDEIEKRKHPEVAAHFKKCAQRLAGKIENLQKTNVRIAKAKEDVAAYNEGRIPAGQRSFTPSFETPLLDELQLTEDYVIQFTVKKDTTIREAKRLLHVLNLASQKCMDLKLMERQRFLNKEATTRNAFIESCVAVPEKVKSQDMFTMLDLDDGGITVPDLDKQKLETKALSLYLKTVEAAAKAKALECEQKLKAAKTKVDKEAKLAAKPPEEVLKETVKIHVESQLKAWAKKGKGKGKQSGKAAEDAQTSLPSKPIAKQPATPKAKAQSEPKNGVSPAKGGGKSSKGKGKGKVAAEKGAGRGKGSGGKNKGGKKGPAQM